MKLIDKSALVAEIERRKEECEEDYQKYGSPYDSVVRDEMENILSFLDTLEVKEVDLEKEIKEEYLKRRQYGGKINMLVILNEPQFNEIAKHFFELGLKAAQKGEKI